MSIIRLNNKGVHALQNKGLNKSEIHLISIFLNSSDQVATANALFISHGAVKCRMSCIYNKLDFKGVTLLWQWFIRERLIELVESEECINLPSSRGCP